MTLNEMISGYNSVAYTHNYIFGFTFSGMIYSATVSVEILPQILTLDTASRGCGKSLRFCPTNKIKSLLLAIATPICSVETFVTEVENSKYNRGEIFEKFITELNGQEWVKDNIPFTKAGDIEINGTAYQIKFEKATFCNEKSLANLVA